MFSVFTKMPTVLSIGRVIKRGDCSPVFFYQGLMFRTLERFVEALPMLICFFWLSVVKTHEDGHQSNWPFFLEYLNHIHHTEGELYLYQNIVFFGFILAALFFLQWIFAYLGQRQSFLGSYLIIQNYRERLINRVRQLPLGSLYQYRSGQLAEVLTQDIKRIESIFTHVAADVFSAVIAPVIWLVMLLWLDWQLALSLIAGLPLAVVILNVSRDYFYRACEHKHDLSRDTAGMLTEFTLGIQTLRLFDQTKPWLAKLRQRFDDLKAASVGVEAWGAGPVVSYRLILEASVVVMLMVMIGRTNAAMASSPEMFTGILFLLLTYKLLIPLLEISEQLSLLRLATQSEEKIEEIFNLSLLFEPKKAQVPERFDICFDRVNFSYEQEAVLNEVSFTVPENTVTAIVGSSGAGKTSIVNLVARFYQASSGTIRIGGHDLADIGTEQLYQHISIVFQQVQLYDASVMENVRAGRKTASDAEVIAACKAANCDSFIQQLPNGYQSSIGEGGARLSGGERQRLSIARGFLKNASILLLDEITASVDPQNQYYINQALNILAKDKTVIIIAHRLNTVVNADQILVMDKGQVVECGKHESLLQNKGLYHKIWSAQDTRSR